MRTKKTEENQINKIPLFDNFYYRSDESQFILCENVTRTSKKDEEQYDGENVLGYYPSIVTLCKGLIKVCTLRGVTSGEITTLRGTIALAEEVEKKLESLIHV